MRLVRSWTAVGLASRRVPCGRRVLSREPVPGGVRGRPRVTIRNVGYFFPRGFGSRAYPFIGVRRAKRRFSARPRRGRPGPRVLPRLPRKAVFPPRLRLFGTPLGFRLEAADHVALESPFEDVEGERFGPVHNLRFTLNVLGLIDDL